ncbi:Uncharacterised protein [Enterobacter kobei]|nr:Uncharacterised protein [Enterobacter kobei]
MSIQSILNKNFKIQILNPISVLQVNIFLK